MEPAPSGTVSQGVPQIVTQPKSCLSVEQGGRGNILMIQATGVGLQYQWCKRVASDSTSPETTDTRIFTTYSRDFEQNVNVDTLCPALYKTGLITREQMEELVQEVPGNTNSRKIKRLLLWLPSSSGHFLDKLIQCLREGGELGHWEVAGSLERALWTPMSSHNVHYAGVNNSTLVLCGVGETHRGLYCCRVTSSCSDRSVLSEPARVELVKPDESAKEAFISELQAHPEKGAELAQTLIGRLQPGSSVGYYALSTAIKSCGEVTEVVRAFLACGWSPTEQLEGEGGRTLVHILAGEGHTDTLMLILQTCPTEEAVKTTDESRCTPLHVAVGAGRLETVLALLEMKEVQGTVNYQDKDFNTALHLAVENGSVEVVQALLLVPDINTGILNRDNLKAVEVAKKNKLHPIVKALEDKERPFLMSPMASNGFGPRANSYDCNIHRSASSGYASSSAGTLHHRGSLARTESLQLLNAADREMMELQRRLSNYRGTLTGKKLLKQGPVRKCTRKGAKKEVYLFLLTDVLLYSKYSELTRKYSVACELSIRDMKVVDKEEGGLPVVRNEPLSFTVSSREKAIHLVASSPEEKEEWIQALRDAISDLLAAQRHHLANSQLLPGAGLGSRAPVWVPDPHVTACQLSNCNKKFSLIERKHHCRHCGRAVCNACSKKRRYLIYLQKEERVCDECIDEFSGRKELSETHLKDQREETETTVMSGYVNRLYGGKTDHKFCKLISNNVLFMYGAHEDTTATHSIMLIGYSVHGDQGSYRVTLTHHQDKEELNHSFVTAAEDYERWLRALKTASRS